MYKISENQRITLNQIDKYNLHFYYSLLTFKFRGKSIIYRVYNNELIKSYLISPKGRLIYYKEIPFPNQSKFTRIDLFMLKNKLKLKN